MKKKTIRKMTNMCGATSRYALFRDLRIKVNNATYFKDCRFVNCTFIGKGKLKANFLSCDIY